MTNKKYINTTQLTRLRIEEPDQAKVVTHMIDLQNLFPISKLVICSSFFLVFLHEVFVIIFYSKSFVAFLSYICALFLFFSAVFNFWINGVFLRLLFVSHIWNAPITNSSIRGVTIGSIFNYFSLSINELLSLRL